MRTAVAPRHHRTALTAHVIATTTTEDQDALSRSGRMADMASVIGLASTTGEAEVATKTTDRAVTVKRVECTRTV